MKLPTLSTDNRWLTVLLLFTLLNGLLWSLLIPFDGAPDEVHKYEVVYFIWSQHRLPVFGPTADLYIREAPGTRDGYVYGASATYPPGAYILSAALMALTPSRDPRLLLHVARLASVLCTVGTVGLAYQIVRRLFGSPAYALGAATLVALIPQFTYTGAYVGDDAYMILGATGCIWAAVRGTQEGWTLRNRLWLALALLWVTLGKQNGWVAAFPFTLFALLSTWRGGWRRRLEAWATMFLPPLLTLAAWLARNQWLYGDLFAYDVGLAAWMDYTHRIGWLDWAPPARLGLTVMDLFLETRWPGMAFESFWGSFFYLNVLMDPRIYRALLIVTIGGLSGTLVALIAARRVAVPTVVAAKVLGVSALALALLLASFVLTSYYNDFQPQGRYLFPLIAPIAMFLTLGPYTLSRMRGRRWNVLWGIGLLLLLALNGFALAVYICGTPYPQIPLPAF